MSTNNDENGELLRTRNREHARQSRKRKKQKIEEYTCKIEELEKEINLLKEQNILYKKYYDDIKIINTTKLSIDEIDKYFEQNPEYNF